MIAFHGDPAIKAKYIARVQAHRLADELVRGSTGQNGKGCAVWCTLDKYDHAAYETELGIPQSLARLEDGLFESLPIAEAMEWPTRFLDAIPVGADLELVLARFMHWILVDPTDGVIKFAKTEQPQKAIVDVATLYERKIAGEEVSQEYWRKAAAEAEAAEAAAAYASSAEAYATAASEAYAYATAEAYAASFYAAAEAYAAASSAASYAAYAASSAAAKIKARSRQAEKLIELLRDTRVEETEGK